MERYAHCELVGRLKRAGGMITGHTCSLGLVRALPLPLAAARRAHGRQCARLYA